MAKYLIQGETLIAIADEVRELSGTTDAMRLADMTTHVSDANAEVTSQTDLVAQIKTALEGKASGGGGSNIPDAEETTFGLYDVVTEEETDRYLYNGVSLPPLPADVLASHPYCWIRNNTTSGYYDLIMSTGIWFCSATNTLNHNDSNACKWYRVGAATMESATEWIYNNDTTSSGWGCESGRDILWSNHDIPNGSATATDIYFEGSDPVAEIGEVVTQEMVEREAAYEIPGDRLNGIAEQIQRLSYTREPMTPEEMETVLENVPAANSFIRFGSRAQGWIPEYDHGYATSTLTLAGMFESSAVGAVNE